MDREAIDQACQRFGFEAGWRFLTCPERNIGTANLLVVTMNPAGTAAHGPKWSQELGSAYVHESWKDKPAGREFRQVRFQRLCEMANEHPDNVLSAHFVPFRTPNWSEVSSRADVLEFSLTLWRWLLAKARAAKVVVLGKGVLSAGLGELLGANRPVSTIPSGHKPWTLDVYATERGWLLASPQLSRYDPGGTEQRLAMKQAFDLAARTMADR